MATIIKVIRRARGKAYEYHAVRFTDPGTGKESCAISAATRRPLSRALR